MQAAQKLRSAGVKRAANGRWPWVNSDRGSYETRHARTVGGIRPLFNNYSMLKGCFKLTTDNIS